MLNHVLNHVLEEVLIEDRVPPNCQNQITTQSHGEANDKQGAHSSSLTSSSYQASAESRTGFSNTSLDTSFSNTSLDLHKRTRVKPGGRQAANQRGRPDAVRFDKVVRRQGGQRRRHSIPAILDGIPD